MSEITLCCAAIFLPPLPHQVTSPLFQDQIRLPTPLGSFLYTAPSFTNLNLPDRLTALPLVTHLLRHDADAESYAAYDALSAWELFSLAGVSESLYKRFLEPMLLVTLFAPPTELSAAAALGGWPRMICLLGCQHMHGLLSGSCAFGAWSFPVVLASPSASAGCRWPCCVAFAPTLARIDSTRHPAYFHVLRLLLLL
jgi:hypothetical protein